VPRDVSWEREDTHVTENNYVLSRVVYKLSQVDQSERLEESLRVVREQYLMPCNGVYIFGRKDWCNHPRAVWLYPVAWVSHTYMLVTYIRARAPEKFKLRAK
jgi:hypothetical protein